MDYNDYKWHKYSSKWNDDNTIRVVCWECYEMPNMVIMSVKIEIPGDEDYYFRALRRDADNTLHDITGKLKHMYLAKWRAWKYYYEEGISII